MIGRQNHYELSAHSEEHLREDLVGPSGQARKTHERPFESTELPLDLCSDEFRAALAEVLVTSDADTQGQVRLSFASTQYKRPRAVKRRTVHVMAASYICSYSVRSCGDRALATLIPSPGADPATVPATLASDVAELLGVRGGVLRRLSGVGVAEAQLEALASYRRGAAIEASHHLAQTYNRGNAMKLALITGEGTVAGLRSDLRALRDALASRLATDERAADDAWLWADMGDARLLLGETGDAASGYEAFAAKARTDSPATTLAVITDIVGALQEHGDPAANAIAAALADVAATLGQR